MDKIISYIPRGSGEDEAAAKAARIAAYQKQVEAYEERHGRVLADGAVLPYRIECEGRVFPSLGQAVAFAHVPEGKLLKAARAGLPIPVNGRPLTFRVLGRGPKINDSGSKPVRCVTGNWTEPSLRKAALRAGCSMALVHRAVTRHVKAKGLEFEYASPVLQVGKQFMLPFVTVLPARRRK